MSAAPWLNLALSRQVALRAAAYAVVVGPILIAINHGGAIVAGQVGGRQLWQMALTLCVPYLVSTFSSVGALRKPVQHPGLTP